MVVWSGWGILIGFIGLGCSALMMAIVNSLFRDAS
jgi:hypothetical protein